MEEWKGDTDYVVDGGRADRVDDVDRQLQDEDCQ